MLFRSLTHSHPPVFYAAAIFPESEKLIDISSLFKIEGTFLNPMDGFKGGWGVGGRAEKQGFALLMLDEGDALAMLHWIVGLSDAFKVRLSTFDDVSELTLTCPALRTTPRFLLRSSRPFVALLCSPCWTSSRPSIPGSRMCVTLHQVLRSSTNAFLRAVVDTLDVNESRPRAIRAVFHSTFTFVSFVGKKKLTRFCHRHSVRPHARDSTGRSRATWPSSFRVREQGYCAASPHSERRPARRPSSA